MSPWGPDPLVKRNRTEDTMKALLGKKIKLASAIDYNKDSIVSKELVRKKAGTVTLFAVDKGQGMSSHSAPFDAIACVVDGVADITVGKKLNKLKTGDMIIMPANIPHALKARVKFKFMLVMIKA
jgi:quercetin dioxygenase-like cupin family protein